MDDDVAEPWPDVGSFGEAAEPAAAAWPEHGPDRGFGDGSGTPPRLDRPGLGRRVGDLLIFLTGTPPGTVEADDRSRFVTAGVLMLLTAGLAVYAGANVAALGFHTSLVATLPFGLVYAAFILFIDRSVLLTVAGYRARRNRVRIRHVSGTHWVRILIAICAGLLVTESILLSFFADSIEPKKDEIKSERLAEAMAKWDAGRAAEDKVRSKERDDAVAAKEKADGAVTDAQTWVNCQQVGGTYKGQPCERGPGPIFQQALDSLQKRQGEQTTAQDAVTAAQRSLTTFRATRDTDRATYLKTETAKIDGGDDLLLREAGFWRLTMDDHSVLAWRIILTLLLFGIDLAPLMFKRTLDSTAQAERERSVLWARQLDGKANALQLWRNHTAHRAKAKDIAAGLLEYYEKRAVNAFLAQQRIAEARQEAEAELELMRIELDKAARLRDLAYRYRMPLPPTRPMPTPIPTIPKPTPPPDDDVLVVPMPPPEPGPEPGPDPGPGPEPEPSPVPMPGPGPAPDPDPDPAPDPGPDPGPIPDTVPEQPLIGQVIKNRWRIDRPLSNADLGGQGVVWHGTDLQGREPKIVIKTVHAVDRRQSSAAETQLAKARALQREMDVADEMPGGAGRNRRFIGEILDYGTFTDSVQGQRYLFIVMPEYHPGSLERHCTLRPTRPLGWCLRTTDQILAGMAAAAERGLVHHDLKPANVVLDGETPRIIDWGLARFYQRTPGPSALLRMGTPFFCAPEQLSHEGDWSTPLADLFSIGGILYQLVGGEAPLLREYLAAGVSDFDLFSYYQLAERVRPVRLDAIHRELPAPVADLADRWLSYDPDRRAGQGVIPRRALEAARADLGRVHAAVRSARQTNLPVGRVGR